MGLGSSLLSDVVYKQHPTGEYIFDTNNDFSPNSIGVLLEQIAKHVVEISEKISNSKGCSFLKECEVFIDYTLLRQVLYRYSRDIYGPRRFRSQIENLSTVISKERTSKIISHMKDYGFKISSYSPYLHRRVSAIFYWVSVLKPFHLNIKQIPKDISSEKSLLVVNYYNEFILYALLKGVMNECMSEGKKLTIRLIVDEDSDKNLFSEFLYDLHYRKLSRTSLEFFFANYCIIQ